MKKLHSFLIIIPYVIFCTAQCSSASIEDDKKTPNGNSNKITGVSFVSPPNNFEDSLMLLPRTKVGANWVCFMPFGFIRKSSNQVEFNQEWQWWGEKKEGVVEMIARAKKQKYKLMLKPQIWIGHGAFTGHHKYESEDDWGKFESSYSAFIMPFAKIADSLNIEIFCIGTEFEQFVLNRPKYWKKLIDEIRTIYRGQITYASNWDEFNKVPFWKDLDYIGIDGYFPIVKSESPNADELKNGWSEHKNKLKRFSDSIKSSILFTEYGYRSRNYLADKPWKSDRGGVINLKLQSRAYEVFYKEIWHEDYIAGGFIWKWFPNYYDVGGLDHTGFTPQRKPVEKIIKNYYKSNSSN